jgi:hypothetical protein
MMAKGLFVPVQAAVRLVTLAWRPEHFQSSSALQANAVLVCGIE